MPQVENRLTIVETALAEFIIQSNKSLYRLGREITDFKDGMEDFKDEMKDFKDEMKDFKDEMKDFKDEMKDFKDEMKDFKDEMKDFKDEMKDFKDRVTLFMDGTEVFRNEMKVFKDEMKDFKDRVTLFMDGTEVFRNEMKVFKDEMKDFKDRVTLFMDGTEVFRNEMKVFKDEMKEDRREMNRQWGALSNKMGTLVEDIIAPAVRPAVRKYFGEEVLDIMVNRKKYDKGQKLRGEFDVIAVTATSVYLVDTKVSPDKDKLLEFKNKVAPRFRKLFPEYGKLQLVLLFASLWFDKKLIDFATKEKVYILAYREWDYMDILNFEDLKAG